VDLPVGLKLNRLQLGRTPLVFDCGIDDLNDFLLTDSIKFAEELLAVTYLLEDENRIVAFFSVSNDRISVEDVDNPNRWKKLRKKLPSGKLFKSYPAVKIGRLAVCKQDKNKGIGTALLDYIKLWFIENNKTGCRFITVDAYNKSLGFYQKNGFIFMTSKDEGKDTRLMYFDLSSLQNQLATS
jgi:GNAT superfamily N-acetyltransferase